jgi:hypothetical protein
MPVEEGKKKRRKLNADPSPQALWVETQRATLCAKREGGHQEGCTSLMFGMRVDP